MHLFSFGSCTHGQSTHTSMGTQVGSSLPHIVALSISGTPVWMARANPYPTNTRKGGSDLRNHQSCEPITHQLSYDIHIHNIVNANISLVLHVNKHIVRQKANNGTRAVAYVIYLSSKQGLFILTSSSTIRYHRSS